MARNCWCIIRVAAFPSFFCNHCKSLVRIHRYKIDGIFTTFYLVISSMPETSTKQVPRLGTMRFFSGSSAILCSAC